MKTNSKEFSGFDDIILNYDFCLLTSEFMSSILTPDF